MLTITKGNRSLRVSKGAYKEYYEAQGWRTTSTPCLSDVEMSSMENSQESIEEKSLEDMSTGELKQYASLLGIKTKNMKDRGQIIEAIKIKEGE